MHTAKGRQDAGVFMVEGPKCVRQIATVNSDAVVEILVDESSEYIAAFSGNVRLLPPRQFHSITASTTPQGVAAIINIPHDVYQPFLPGQTGNRVLLCEEIQDPGNVGTLIRTAAAFDFSGVILSDTCADPFAPKAVQASAGAILSPWIRRAKGYLSLIDNLQKQGFFLAAADIGGKETTGDFRAKKVLLALGNEGKGLSKTILDRADNVFRIPYNTKTIESLNVAAAGAICMYCIGREKR